MNVKRSAEDVEKENVVLRSMVKMCEKINESDTPYRILSQLWLEVKEREHEPMSSKHACDFLFSELKRYKVEVEMLRLELLEIKDQNLSLHSDIKLMMTRRL